MKYAVIALGCLVFNSLAFATVAKSYDQAKSCTLYQAVAPNEQGEVKLKPNQSVVSDKNVYGLSFRDMEVDFERKEVLVQATINVIMGMNRPLIEGKSIIRDNNPNFNFLINQINRNVMLFEKLCINAKNEVVYAKFYSNQNNK